MCEDRFHQETARENRAVERSAQFQIRNTIFSTVSTRTTRGIKCKVFGMWLERCTKELIRLAEFTTFPPICEQLPAEMKWFSDPISQRKQYSSCHNHFCIAVASSLSIYFYFFVMKNDTTSYVDVAHDSNLSTHNSKFVVPLKHPQNECVVVRPSPNRSEAATAMMEMLVTSTKVQPATKSNSIINCAWISVNDLAKWLN